jgi:hypothetical protein
MALLKYIPADKNQELTLNIVYFCISDFVVRRDESGSDPKLNYAPRSKPNEMLT